MSKNIQPKIVESEEQKKAKETIKVIAENISSLADAVTDLINGPLKKKTLVTLLASSAGLSKSDTERVLDSLVNLEKDWLNK